MKRLFPGCLQKTLRTSLSLALSYLFLCANAQTTVFNEDFEQWSAQNPGLPQGWLLGANSCNTGPSCYWSEPGDFPMNSQPSQFGCKGSGLYARANSSGLSNGEVASMISPAIDLRNPGNVTDVSLGFCLINPSSNGLGTDQVEILYSINGGQTWESQLLENNVYPNWTQLSLPVPANMWVNNFRVRIDAIGGADQMDLGIDDLQIVQMQPTCQAGNSQVFSSLSGQICKNHEFDITLLSNDDTGSADYAYILTDPLDRVIFVSTDTLADLNLLPVNDYRIYGVSYSGNLNATPGQSVFSISASLCHVLSSNFVSFFVVDLDLDLRISDYNGFGVSISAGQDGRIEVLSPANSNYTYTWSHDSGLSGAIATQLSAGNYLVLVTDPNTGCSEELSISLSEPSPMVGTVEIVSDYNGFPISCFNASDASLKANIQGGVRPYRYVWQGTLRDSTLENVPAGTYTLNVIDFNGALIQIQQEVSGPEVISLQNGSVFYVCHGENSNEISLDVSGGTGAYSYQWSNGSTNPTVNNLEPGVITVDITDENGCSESFELEVQEALELSTDPIFESPACPGDSSGSILLFTTGGRAPYTFQWSNGEVEEDLVTLQAGTYNVKIQDALGCEIEEEFTLENPTSLTYTLDVFPDKGSQDGAARIQIETGNAPFTYVWSNGETGESVENLAAGSYSVVVTDAGGCSLSIPFEIDFPQRPSCLDIHMGFSPNGDGINDRFVIPCLEAYPENELQILNRWGQELFYMTSYDNSWEGTANGKALTEGTYFYVIHIYSSEGLSVHKGSVSIIK